MSRSYYQVPAPGLSCGFHYRDGYWTPSPALLQRYEWAAPKPQHDHQEKVLADRGVGHSLFHAIPVPLTYSCHMELKDLLKDVANTIAEADLTA